MNNYLAELFGHWEVRVLIICLFVFGLERLRPWRKEQAMFRPQLLQDIFWFAFNAFALGVFFGFVFGAIAGGIKGGLVALFGPAVLEIQILGSFSLPVQIIISLVLIDLVEWGVHNLLHRVPALWRLHKVHHSIHDMDWIGNYRFHPFEIFLYFSLRYVPVLLLGASKEAVMVTGGLGVLIGNLNHSNLNISWGPLRYVFNSPRMHIWHHEAKMRNRAGVNFGITLSVWDWLFGTAYMPNEGVPERLGFGNDDQYPDALWRRFFFPFLDRYK